MSSLRCVTAIAFHYGVVQAFRPAVESPAIAASLVRLREDVVEQLRRRRDRGLARAPTSERAAWSEAGSWLARGNRVAFRPRDPWRPTNPGCISAGTEDFEASDYSVFQFDVVPSRSRPSDPP